MQNKIQMLERQLIKAREAVQDSVAIINDFIDPKCQCDQCGTLRQIKETVASLTASC